MPTVGRTSGKKCMLTGKKANNGWKVTFSHHRSHHLQQPNLQWKRIWWPEGNRFVRLKISTKALKTIDAKGIDIMAKVCIE